MRDTIYSEGSMRDMGSLEGSKWDWKGPEGSHLLWRILMVGKWWPGIHHKVLNNAKESGRVQKIHEESRLVLKGPEGSWRVKRVLKGTTDFTVYPRVLKSPEGIKRFLKCSEGSSRILKGPEGFKGPWRILKGLEGSWRIRLSLYCPKDLEGPWILFEAH